MSLASSPHANGSDVSDSQQALGKRLTWLEQQLVLAESSTVLAALRRNARWRDAYAASSPTAATTPTSMLDGFWDLRQRIGTATVGMALQPFLAVITNPETTGPMTAAALSAIDRSMTLGMLGKD